MFQDFRYSDTERLSRSDEVLKLKNFKKDATLKLFKSTNQERYEHVGPKSQIHKMAKFQDGEEIIKLADKQAEAITSNQQVEKLQEDLIANEGEISYIFEGLSIDISTISDLAHDVTPYVVHLPKIDDMDELETSKVEEAQEAYMAAIAAAKEMQDEESVTAAANARVDINTRMQWILKQKQLDTWEERGGILYSSQVKLMDQVCCLQQQKLLITRSQIFYVRVFGIRIVDLEARIEAEVYARLEEQVQQILASLQKKVPFLLVISEDINQKFLRILPPSWNQIALIMRNKPDIDEIDIDDLYNNLRVYEDEMKRSSSFTSTSQNLAFLSSENTSSTNEVSTASGDFGVSTAEGISQINEDELEELDLRWDCRSGRNQGKRSYGDNGRSNAPTNESSSQALVAQDGLGGYDWSNDFEVEPVDYALMAISSSSSSSSFDNEDWTLMMRMDVSEVQHINVKTNETQTIKTRVDKISQTSQKQGIGFKKIKACFVCKNTDHLIKDCNFHDKQRVLTRTSLITPVKQNEKRAVHKVSTARTVSTARSVSIARHVSTVRPFDPKIAQTSGAIRPIYLRMDNVAEAPYYLLEGNPEILLQDHAVVDSGCSSHMTGNKAYLSDYQDYNGGFVAFGSDPKGVMVDVVMTLMEAMIDENVGAMADFNNMDDTINGVKVISIWHIKEEVYVHHPGFIDPVIPKQFIVDYGGAAHAHALESRICTPITQTRCADQFILSIEIKLKSMWQGREVHEKPVMKLKYLYRRRPMKLLKTWKWWKGEDGDCDWAIWKNRYSKTVKKRTQVQLSTEARALCKKKNERTVIGRNRELQRKLDQARDGNTNYHKTFKSMLKSFDRHDLEILVDPEQDDDIWKNQNQWKIISWKLYETCGVHTLMVDGEEFNAVNED
ncbi:putative ribonuclease H-like domain-containing protein [Tanacetum coccineum]|uniref:Ribonuclease H-like domain-containing protein n=1 Tax=Tanacetum coccineum TaxID=301880 RepID=A0ABQ5HEC4_9ASTR